jgi:3-dehydroquinate synthase
MHKIKLKLKAASSNILVGRGLYGQLPRLLDDEGLSGPFLVVSQPGVLGAIDNRPLERNPVALIPDGEKAKTLRTVERLLDRMLELEMTRQSTIVAVGGGVVGDVAGFAASLFLRGVSVVQVPTTLLAQVDSSVGGKTGVNHRRGKNLIGSFHQPRLVVADPQLLATLPPRQYRSGLYETLKYGVIRDQTIFRAFERQPAQIADRNPDVVEDLIHRSLRIKARVVSADEKEGNLRRILNFGHTIGHAIEAASHYRSILHGEAVGYGMIGAARIASRLDLLEESECRRIEAAVGSIGHLPSIAKLSLDDMLDAMRHDKKVRDGRLHFILPESVGTVTVRAGVSSRVVRSVLRHLGRT